MMVHHHRGASLGAIKSPDSAARAYDAILANLGAPLALLCDPQGWLQVSSGWKHSPRLQMSSRNIAASDSLAAN
jgi:hypothetical protein